MPGESNDNCLSCELPQYSFDQLHVGINQWTEDQKTNGYLPSFYPTLAGLVSNSYFLPRVPLYPPVTLGVPFQPCSSPCLHRARRMVDFVAVGEEPSSTEAQSGRDGGGEGRGAVYFGM